MKIDLYNDIKDTLLGAVYVKEDETTDSIKTVALWRNQLRREAEEMPFLMPAVFIEYLPANFTESSSKVFQTVDLTVRLHVCFESKKTEDLDIFHLIDRIHFLVQGLQSSTFGNMKRRAEEQDFDHDNVQDYQMDYLVTQGRDYGADRRPSTPAQVDNLTINAEFDQDLED